MRVAWADAAAGQASAAAVSSAVTRGARLR